MLLSPFALPSWANESSSLIGDVDGDGFILPRDAAIVARYLARWEDYVDEDGALTYPDQEDASFCVGYGRVDVTPDLSYYARVPLAGFGNTNSRLASGVPDGDGIYVTCIALRDESGEVMLLFTMDRLSLSGLKVTYHKTYLADCLKSAVERATGISADNMAVNVSHTHSAPEGPTSFLDSPAGWGYMTRYYQEVFQKGVQAARRALADLSPATLWAGDTSVADLNFVRRHLTWYASTASAAGYQTRSVIGEGEGTTNRVGYEAPNPVDDGGVYYEHETPADNEVQYLVFKREGVKDVLLYNWQCHADITGNDCYDLNEDGSYHAFSYNASDYKNINKTILAPGNRVITSDYIAGVRRVLDEQEGYLTAFFNGGSGNMNYYDYVGYAMNARYGRAEYEQYRLPGWDDRYYDYASSFSTSTGRKGYWKSQMVGAIVADAIKKDIAATDSPFVYDTPVHHDVVSTQAQSGRTYVDEEGNTQSVISHNWTNDFAGMVQLPTGKLNMIHSTYYTTFENDDLALKTVMSYLSDLARYGRVSVGDGGDILLRGTEAIDPDASNGTALYTITYTYKNKTGTETITEKEVDAIRALAREYAQRKTVAEQKAFAWEVLNTYRDLVVKSFSAGMYENGGSGGSYNAAYKKARTLARLATGLYLSNYSANALYNRISYTDLDHEDTDVTKYTEGVPLSCLSIGKSVAFTFMPYEMFDTVGQMIKDGRYIVYDESGAPVTETRVATPPTGKSGSTYTGLDGAKRPYPSISYEAATYTYTDAKSPFPMTFACGYTDGSVGYMPTRYARFHPESQNYQNGYETYVTYYAAGSTEDHTSEILEMLHLLYTDGDTSPRVTGHLPGVS